MTDIHVELQTLETKPGDVILIQLGTSLAVRDFERLAGQILPAVPLGVTALLMPYGMTVDLVRVDDIVPTPPPRVFRVKGPSQ